MTHPLPHRPTHIGMTPQQWATLPLAQQQAHITRYGPPPPGWAQISPPAVYQPTPAPAPVINVTTTAQATNINRSGGGCGATILLGILIWLSSYGWWAVALAGVVVVLVGWAMWRAHT